MAGILEGIRVLDFGQAAVGPLSATYLGVLGADVIKIESPGGDRIRFHADAAQQQGMETTFIGVNYTKRGIVLNLKDPADNETARRLIATADVVLDNFRSKAVMERLGLGYDVMRAINPAIIYLQASAYGSRGPYVGMMSNDRVAQAAAGCTSVNGVPGGEPEFLRGSAATADWNGGMLNCVALLTALLHRERTGQGGCVETNQFQSAATTRLTRWAEFFASGIAPGPMGSARANIVPDQAFSTALGSISVTVPHDGVWPRFCRALGLPGLIEDPRFSTNTMRVRHKPELLRVLEATFEKKAAWHWIKALREHRVPCGEYFNHRPRSIAVLEHPQVQANRMMQTIQTAWGPSNTSSGHWRFSKNTTSIARGAPIQGEHQQEVLEELEWLQRIPAHTHGAPRAALAANGAGPAHAHQPRLALQGLKVIDVSQGVSGPMCAMMLGDLGAEVIKVEPPGGDWLRGIGPFENGESSLFIRFNRNKKSVVLDLKTAAGKAAFRQLASDADVLVEGYRPAVMGRLGLGYQDLMAENARLVYCSISGYGSQGPLADQPATELDVQALAGEHRTLGVPGHAPLRIGFDLISMNAAWAAIQGVLAALFWREKTGEGQSVETSLLDAAVAIMQFVTAAESNPDEWDPQRKPFSSYDDPPDHGFRSKELPFFMSLGKGDEEFRRFCQIVGMESVADDPRFTAFSDRDVNDVELKQTLNPALSQWAFEDLRGLVQSAFGGTIVPLHNLATLADDPQVAALGLIKELEHPIAGPYRTVDIPWEFSQAIARLSPVPAPRLNEHAADILASLGHDSERTEPLEVARSVSQ